MTTKAGLVLTDTMSVLVEAHIKLGYEDLAQKRGHHVSDMLRTAVMRYLAEEQAKELWGLT